MSDNTPANITGGLSDLRDIIVPESVDVFPLAPAWYIAGAVLVFLIARSCILKYKKYRENKYRRDAELKLDHFKNIILNSSDERQKIKAAAALPVLLKQVAISAYKRETVAGLSQDKWLAFLDEKTFTKAFATNNGLFLSICSYGTEKQIKKIPDKAFEDLIALIRQWIKRHKKELE